MLISLLLQSMSDIATNLNDVYKHFFRHKLKFSKTCSLFIIFETRSIRDLTSSFSSIKNKVLTSNYVWFQLFTSIISKSKSIEKFKSIINIEKKLINWWQQFQLFLIKTFTIRISSILLTKTTYFQQHKKVWNYRKTIQYFSNYNNNNYVRSSFFVFFETTSYYNIWHSLKRSKRWFFWFIL